MAELSPETYDCTDESGSWTSWPSHKQHWCCRHHHKACPTEAPAPTEPNESHDGRASTTASGSWSSRASLLPSHTLQHNCSDDRNALKTWSRDKRKWCCREEMIGCTACDHICDLEGQQATCRRRVEWLKSHKFNGEKNSCEMALGVVLRDCSVCSACTFDDACPAEAAEESASLMRMRASSDAEEAFSCTPAVPGEEDLWSPERRRWCCEHRGRGCVGALAPTATTQTATAEATTTQTTTTRTIAEAVDCENGADVWQDTWSQSKKEHCCKTANVGCSDHKQDCSTICTYSGVGASCQDRVDWLVAHGMSNKAGACPVAHREVVEQCDVCKGCKVEDACPDKAVDEDVFDCDEDAEHWRTKWPQAKRTWCCESKGKGCADLAPTTTTVTRQSMTDAEEPLFDCKKGVSTWQTTWTAKKQSWCCAKERLGCLSAIDCQEHGGCTEEDPYDCVATDDRSVQLWTPGQKAWCCKHRHVGAGCELPDDESTWNCQAEVLHWEEDWPDAKKEWCCEHYKIGCSPGSSVAPPTTTVLPRSYNCQLGIENWQHVWSPTKAAWCCKHRLVGCGGSDKPSCDGQASDWTELQKAFCCKTKNAEGCPEASDGDDAARYSCDGGDAASWSPSKRAWCCAEKGIACITAAPPATEKATTQKTTSAAPSYDCGDVGEVAPATWAAAHKEWCCKNEDRGCQAACYDHNVAYLPFDMPGQFVSYEAGPERCQERCRRTDACKHFTYLEREGSCHISDDTASQVTWFDAFSGPASCKPSGAPAGGGEAQGLTEVTDGHGEAARFRARQLVLGMQDKAAAAPLGRSPLAARLPSGNLATAIVLAIVATIALATAVAAATRGHRSTYTTIPSWRSREQEYSAVGEVPLPLM